MSALEKTGHLKRPDIEAARPAVSERPIEALDQDQEPEASGDEARDGCVRVRLEARPNAKALAESARALING